MLCLKITDYRLEFLERENPGSINYVYRWKNATEEDELVWDADTTIKFATKDILNLTQNLEVTIYDEITADDKCNGTEINVTNGPELTKKVVTASTNQNLKEIVEVAFTIPDIMEDKMNQTQLHHHISPQSHSVAPAPPLGS